MIIIINDDPVYLSWVRRHRDGFVLDTKSKSTKRNTTLHRAMCDEIRKAKTRRTRWTTAGRMKVCADSRDDLVEWAREQVGCAPKYCEHCCPTHDEAAPTPWNNTRVITRLEQDIVSCVVESAVIHLDNELDYHTTIADVASYLSKTPAQIAPALTRLRAGSVIEIDAGTGDAKDAGNTVFPTARALRTVPAFAELTPAELQHELDALHTTTSSQS